MYKRTLYIPEETQKKIVALSDKHQKSLAEVLRVAVDLGLDQMMGPDSHMGDAKNASVGKNTVDVPTAPMSKKDDPLTRLFRFILQ